MTAANKLLANQLSSAIVAHEIVPDEGIKFPSTAPMHISLFVLSIGFVMVSHCQQARYVHQFVHHLWGGREHPLPHVYIHKLLLRLGVHFLIMINIHPINGNNVAKIANKKLLDDNFKA